MEYPLRKQRYIQTAVNQQRYYMATLTNAGKVAAAKLLNGVDSVPAFTYMAIGSGSTAEAATQTALVTEITANGGARAAATCSYVASNTAKWEKEFTFTGNVTIREFGVFSALSGGTMFVRHLLAADKAYVSGEKALVSISAVIS